MILRERQTNTIKVRVVFCTFRWLLVIRKFTIRCQCHTCSRIRDEIPSASVITHAQSLFRVNNMYNTFVSIHWGYINNNICNVHSIWLFSYVSNFRTFKACCRTCCRLQCWSHQVFTFSDTFKMLNQIKSLSIILFGSIITFDLITF